MHKNEQLKLQLLHGEESHKYFSPIIIDAACHSYILFCIITSSLANFTNNILLTTCWLQTIVISSPPILWYLTLKLFQGHLKHQELSNKIVSRPTPVWKAAQTCCKWRWKGESHEDFLIFFLKRINWITAQHLPHPLTSVTSPLSKPLPVQRGNIRGFLLMEYLWTWRPRSLEKKEDSCIIQGQDLLYERTNLPHWQTELSGIKPIRKKPHGSQVMNTGQEPKPRTGNQHTLYSIMTFPTTIY